MRALYVYRISATSCLTDLCLFSIAFGLGQAESGTRVMKDELRPHASGDDITPTEFASGQTGLNSPTGRIQQREEYQQQEIASKLWSGLTKED